MQMPVWVGFSVTSKWQSLIYPYSRGHRGSEKWNNLSRIPSYCSVTPFLLTPNTVSSTIPYWLWILVLHLWYISQHAGYFHMTYTTHQFTAPSTGLIIFIVINTVLSFPFSRWGYWRLVACALSEWLSGAAYFNSGLIFIPPLSITPWIAPAAGLLSPSFPQGALTTLWR